MEGAGVRNVVLLVGRLGVVGEEAFVKGVVVRLKYCEDLWEPWRRRINFSGFVMRESFFVGC